MPKYFTHEDVKAAFDDLRKDPANSGPEAQRVQRLIADVGPKINTAVIVFSGNNIIDATTRSLTLGVQLGLKLAGASGRINPDQELSKEFLDESNALIEARKAKGLSAYPTTAEMDASARRAADPLSSLLGLDPQGAVTDKSKWN